MKIKFSKPRPITRAYVESRLHCNTVESEWATNVLACVSWLERQIAGGATLQDALDRHPFYAMPAAAGEVRDVDASPTDWIAAGSVLRQEGVK